MNRLFSIAVMTLSVVILSSSPAVADSGFEYNPPGELVAGSGDGHSDSTVHVPGMRFPIEEAPAFPNSQVWGHGGMNGPAPHDECHSNNYSYPWYDNFCETRWRNASFCPSSGDAHQGQDIRPSTCADSTHWVVAAEGGQVTSIGSYSVWIQSPSGVRHRYLHMNMNQLAVQSGQTVAKGDKLGLVSDDFGGTPTTLHLHYDIHLGGDYISPYMSLVESYKDLIGDTAPPPEFEFDIDVRILGLDDFYDAGSSAGIPDALPDQAFQAEVRLTNQSNEVLRDVEIGLDVAAPFLEIQDYAIDSDHPDYDRETWSTNSADPSQTADNPDQLSAEATLAMHAFSPDESKRVLLDIKAREYSIGQIDDVDLRAWLTHAEAPPEVDVEAVFSGHHGGWDDQASVSEFGAQVRDRAGIDIVDRDQWLFESRAHDRDLEGWQPCFEGHHESLLQNTNVGALALDITGDQACVTAPHWTDIDADRYDEMVIETRAHLGSHDKAIYWASDEDLPAAQFPCQQVERVAGPERYASAVEVSKQAFSNGADEAVLVIGSVTTTDAMVGAALAGARQGPMLLTAGDELPDVVATELQRLGVDRVTIVGGELAVTPAVEDAVTSLGIDVERRAGETGYHTAASVALEMGAPTGTAVVVSTTNEDLVDGIYGASLAAHLNAPILLVHHDGLPESTTDTMADLEIEETILIGGTDSISEDVEQALPAPLRLAGANRHQTALAVADFALSTGQDSPHLYLTRDDEVIDAYPAAATGDITILSSPDALTPGVKSALTTYADRVTLVGGEGALSENVERQACEAFRLRDVYDAHRAARFEAKGDGEFNTYVLPLGEQEDWRGAITMLRLMPQYDRAPTEGENTWQDVGEIYFQSAATQQTSSAVRDYVDGPRVELQPIDDPIDPGIEPDLDPDPDSGSDNRSEVVFGAPGNIETRSSCSVAGSSPLPVAVLVVLLLMAALHRRRQNQPLPGH